MKMIVEVLKTITASIEVEFETPVAALEYAQSDDRLYPPDEDWVTLEGWEYIVLDLDGNILLEDR